MLFTRKEPNLQKYKYLLIGLGFFWMVAWSIFGSLLAVQIQQLGLSEVQATETMLQQRSLLKSAHAHMNTMGLSTILVGLTLPLIIPFFSEKLIKTLIKLYVISIPLFGLGLLLEAFFPNELGKISIPTGISALGGGLYILTLAIWSALFLFKYLQKNGLHGKK